MQRCGIIAYGICKIKAANVPNSPVPLTSRARTRTLFARCNKTRGHSLVLPRARSRLFSRGYNKFVVRRARSRFGAGPCAPRTKKGRRDFSLLPLSFVQSSASVLSARRARQSASYAFWYSFCMERGANRNELQTSPAKASTAFRFSRAVLVAATRLLLRGEPVLALPACFESG